MRVGCAPAIVLVAMCGVVATEAADPLSFFRPDVTTTESDRRQLDRGEPIAHPLAAHDREVAVWAAVPVAIGPDRLVAWIEQIAKLKKSEYVPAIHRFSTPPAIADLAELALDPDDLDAIASCPPGDCDLKLTPDEITALRNEPVSARQGAFRSIVLARVTRYLAGGGSADGSRRVLQHSPFLVAGAPDLVTQLVEPPRIASDSHAFVYWSKERIANRSIVIVTDVRVVRSDEPSRPLVLVVGKEIFWTRYLSAGLGVTALVRGSTPASNYLVYVNRSEVDAVHGWLGGIIRWAIQHRLAADAADVLRGLRTRLESGEP